MRNDDKIKDRIFITLFIIMIIGGMVITANI